MFHTTVGGVVTSATKELNDALHFTQNMHGNIMTPDTAFKTLQTCKTMAVRIYIYIYTYVYIYVHTYICHGRHARPWRSVSISISIHMCVCISMYVTADMQDYGGPYT